MNPHDATKQPGAHLVFEVLAVEDPESLVTLHPSRSPLSMLAALVADASRDADQLHSALLERAGTTIKTLERLTRDPSADLWDSSGVRRSTGGEIGVLAARRGQAFEQLTRAVHSYERCRPAPVNAPTATAALSRSPHSPAPPAVPAPTSAPASTAATPVKPARSR
ncbi:hypothetical protein ACIGXM_25255 [Kitasatospora sp. NPDC052896]|uniref:hypothetical protein n=1 Tax=Kitasatospora sp. NPDC052896 TaxID=3364061 RepID=UPI0037C7BE06